MDAAHAVFHAGMASSFTYTFFPREFSSICLINLLEHTTSSA